MKKSFLAIAIIALLAACGGDAPKREEIAVPKVEKPSAPAGHEAAFDKMQGSDCATCHRTDSELQGPSYIDIAGKYAGKNEEDLKKVAARIISGGQGVWTEKYKMTPHPAITPEEALGMVKYILTFKK